MDIDVKDSDIDGIGAFFYPVVLAVLDRERINSGDMELNKPTSFGIREIMLDRSLGNNTRVLLTDDGFVGIFNKTIKYALEILNTIFATGIVFGVGSAFVRDRDLCKFMLTGDGLHIQLYELGGPSERNLYSFQRDDDSTFAKWRGITYGSKFGRKPAPIQDMEKVLDRSYEYLSAKDLKKNLHKDLLLTLEGYTLYYGRAYNGAYLYGWMIIETVIDELWGEYVNTLPISHDDRRNLKQASQWTTAHHIEILFALKKIDLTNRNFLTELRKKRNHIIHEKETVEWDEAFGCLRLAMVLIYNRTLGNTDIFYDPKGNDLVKKWNCSKGEK